MVFSSITFLFYFLPIFLIVYFVTPTIKGKNVVALLFSLLFYAWGEPRFVLILLCSIVFNFLAALVIDGRSGSTRKLALAVAVAGNLLLLAVFKYANFLSANLSALMAPLGIDVLKTNIALPLGISFFTFHCLSYIIDVYRRRFSANRDPIDIALYISLFPQLVAGPIVRYKTVARQLDARQAFAFPRLRRRPNIHCWTCAESIDSRRRRASRSSRIRSGPQSFLARGMDRPRFLRGANLF